MENSLCGKVLRFFCGFLLFAYGVLLVFVIADCSAVLRMAALPLLGAGLLLLRRAPARFTARQGVFAGLLTVLFLLMLPASSLWQSGWFAAGGLLQAAFFPLVAAAVFLLGCGLFALPVPLSDGKKPSPLLLTGLLAGVMAPVLAGRFPAVFDNDAYSLLLSLCGSEPPAWSDWHTIGYSMLFRLAFSTAGPFLLVVLQTGLYLLAFYWAARTLTEAAPARWAGWLYLALAVCCVSFNSQLAALQKDPLAAVGLFGFSVAVLRQLRGDNSRRNAALLVLFGLCAALFRHMLLPILLATLAVLALVQAVRKKQLRRLGYAALCLVLVYGGMVRGVGFGLLHAQKNPSYVSYSVPVEMCGAVVAAGCALDDADVATLERLYPLDTWRDTYNKYNLDPLTRTWGAVGDEVLKLQDSSLQKELLRLNLKFLLRYPAVYLTAFFDISSILWELSMPADGYVYACVEDTSPMLGEEWSQYQVRETALGRAEGVLYRYTYTTAPWRDLLWRGGASLYALLTAAGLLLARRRLRTLTALLPVGIYTALLFLSVPAQHTRYIFPLLLCAPFYLLFALLTPSSDSPIQE